MKNLILLLSVAALAAAKPGPKPESQKSAFSAVIEAYGGIHRALAADDFGSAKAGSDSMLAALGKGTPANGADSGAAEMRRTLKVMASSRDIATLRSNFRELSLGLVEALGKTGLQPTPSLYHFHCSMAKADWLQGEKVPANPYYGKSMSRCGSLVREVKSP